MGAANLSFDCAVITGGAGGIGRTLAEWMLKLGKKVIIVGRTELKLQTTAKELGSIPYYVLDTGKLADIPRFVEIITKEHPEVDCLVNNAGVQRPLDVKDFDLAKADQEIDINIRGPMHLTISLLPHLKTKPNAVVANVSSVLGFIPFSIVNPVYNGTKAWLHFWSMNLRTQLQGTSVSVVEIIPPQVESDLHRERENPDDNKKTHSKTSLSQEEFLDSIAKGWQEGKDVLTAGPGHGIVDRWYKEFGPDYENAASSR